MKLVGSDRVGTEDISLRFDVLLGSFADVWHLAGGNVAAAPGDAWEDFDLPLDGAVNLGGAHSPSLELLFSASPDLVLASASTASHIAMKDTLEEKTAVFRFCLKFGILADGLIILVFAPLLMFSTLFSGKVSITFSRISQPAS